MADACAELPQGREVGPMRGSEVSRHAAIAGSCVIAMQHSDSKRRYYLAQEARYQGSFSQAPYGTPVTFTAGAVEFGKRQAKSHITATAQNETIAEVTVSYTILTEAAFERLFQNHRIITPQAGFIGELPEGVISMNGTSIRQTVNHVPTNVCSGHFENHPALPVALLTNQLAELGGRLMNSKYFGVHADVKANDLCWAGEQVVFEVDLISEHRGLHVFCGRVHANQRQVCHASIQLQCV
jgi:3-hydroxymyristoyl/3-hydroxydecanoyl-(acyl carrier protein) dehydratase